MSIKSLAYDLTHPLLAIIRSNRWLIRQLFHVRIPADIRVSIDPTTIALANAVRRTMTDDDQHIFEMGIGQAALISLSLAKRQNVKVEGADCSTSRVESSQAVARVNQLEATFIVSDLFSNVPQQTRYDLIFFNVPYVPTAQGHSLKLTERLKVDGDQMWDGGPDGTAVLARFLREAKIHLTHRGRVIFGVQNVFVADALVAQVIACSNYRLIRRERSRWIPACCYVVQPPLP